MRHSTQLAHQASFVALRPAAAASVTSADASGRAPQTPLSAYFRELAGHTVMTREEEVAAATRIAALRANLWRIIFGHVPFVSAVCDFVAVALSHDGRPERRAELTRIARSFDQELPDSGAFEPVRDSLCRSLADVDGAVVDRLVAGIGAVAAGADEMAGLSRLRAKDPSFVRYAAEVRGNHRALVVAKNAFIQANLRLVITIARQYDRGLLPLPDLIQEGNIGLMRAVDRFEPHRGCRFATYAAWWIRHAMYSAIHDKSGDVRLPAHVRVTRSKVRRATREFEAQNGRAPTDAELAASTGISGERLERVRSALVGAPLSLDQSVAESGGLALHEVLTNRDELAVPDRMDEADVAERVEHAFARLTAVEMEILRKHLGLDDEDDGQTLQQIGRTYSLSRERIRQIRKHALVKLRAELRRHGVA